MSAAPTTRKITPKDSAGQASGWKLIFQKSNLKYLFHACVLAGLVFAGMKYVNGGEMWLALRRFNWMYSPAILFLTLAYMLTKGWRFVTLLGEVEHIRRGVILRGYFAAQAATLLPGGMAARAGILEQAGVPLPTSAAAIAHSSLSDQIVLLGASMISALWFEHARKPILIFLSVLLVVSTLLGIQASRQWLLSLVEWILKKVNLLEHWKKFLDHAAQMANPTAIFMGLANAALATALMVEALHLCMKGMGATVSYPTLLLAFTLPSLMGRVSAMPGGVGVTEAGMIGVLNAAPHVSREQAAAAVLLFRIATVLFAALVGALTYFAGWKGERENAVDTTPTS
jgi:uncharacterized protein (TIRG00374 family)